MLRVIDENKRMQKGKSRFASEQTEKHPKNGVLPPYLGPSVNVLIFNMRPQTPSRQDAGGCCCFRQARFATLHYVVFHRQEQTGLAARASCLVAPALHAVAEPTTPDLFSVERTRTMTSDRRPQLAQRRRRVIYAHGLELQGSEVRIAAKRLREARKPTAAYGSRVHRRLRARWFGLVPVRRRTLALVVSVVGGLAWLLTFAHWAAIGWAPLAYAPELARPFRLDRPDSFGTWLGTLLLFSAAGAALLIYQLRRYRSDDFEGRYRIWRPIILLLVLASLDSVVGLLDWGGHLLDAGLGQRKALAGNDWIRLLLTIGGAALSLRLLAEVWQSRLATFSVAAGMLAFAYSALVHWNVLTVQSALSSTFFNAAPLLGKTSIWIAMVAYLRLLYRDVREINEKDRLADRMRSWKMPRLWRAAAVETSETPVTGSKEPAGRRVRTSKPVAKTRPTAAPTSSETEEESSPPPPAPPRARRWFSRKEKANSLGDEPVEPTHDEPAQKDDPADTVATPKPRGSWLPPPPWRRNKPAAEATTADTTSVDTSTDAAEEDADKPPKKSFLSRFSLRLPPPTVKQAQEDDESIAEAEAAAEEAAPVRKKRFGLGLFGKGKPESTPDDAEATETKDEVASRRSKASEPRGKSQSEVSRSPEGSGTEDEEEIDPESIDWASLSKAERRRLKRQLKR